MTWTPNTLEDRLLQHYHEENPGTMYLEVPVGGGDDTHGPRRIDGVLIEGGKSVVHPQHSYGMEAFVEAANGAVVHMLEAKRTLNRNVIGQVVAGENLLEKLCAPASVRSVAVCGDNNTELQAVCRDLGIEVALYPEVLSTPTREISPDPVDGRRDIRNPPDPARRDAFLRGWSAAVDGQLYGSIRKRKTHQNMGNLFGWIYGDRPRDFRVSTWERYVTYATSQSDES